jgi:glycosyltransferase involved in cell wall biosynthesis
MARVHVPTGWSVEFLIIDNGSTDSTEAVFQASDLAKRSARYISEPRPGQSYARNRAIQEARGEIILWTDDDVRVPDDWIERMCKPILENRADAVTGGVVFPSHINALLDELPDPQLRGWFASTDQLGHGRPERLVGANMAFHRRVLSKVPGFDVELGPGGRAAMGFGDDTLFSKQLREAGYAIIGALDVTVDHHFDLDRLERNSLISSAIKMGRTDAFLFHHWEHCRSRLAYIRFGFCFLKWCGITFADRFRKKKTRGSVPISILRIERKLAFSRELIAQRRRPRKYAWHGLTPVRE